MKLKKATFRHIEAEVYSYWDTLKAIDELRALIILAGRQEQEVVVSGGNYATSTVERRATRLADSLLLREMERITDTIRLAYETVRDECRQVVFVKYGLAINWQPPFELAQNLQGRNRRDMTVSEMVFHLVMDESTFYRYRSGFVYGIAEKLGWY